jgi:exopolyphosphatase/guanosine-5'-triphosphate,3'-diphosphate pyrophosphatase
MREQLQAPQKRFAVIDIGTNTFHLLIAAPGENGQSLTEIYRSRHFIKLAEKGIEQLGAEALQRGMNALLFFRQQLDLHEVPDDQLIALGTAALRTASNGPAFREEVFRRTHINIQIISGDREAHLIARGAMMAIPVPKEKVLIMDIGGGSVEFIITDEKGVYWAQSFPVGVAVLYRNFHTSDPISPGEIERVRSFLSLQLQPLFAALQSFPADHLIGAAGTFDVIADHLAIDKKSDATYAPIKLEQFDTFFNKILKTTQQERYDMPEIPKDRADMIVVAVILIDLVLQMADIRQLTVSYYAMKEGMMAEMIKSSTTNG